MEYCKYKTKDGFIGSILHIPEESRDNEFITTGYRIGYRGIKNGLKTMFIPHNESVNVWSHLLGKIFFMCVIV
jgi:adiponectin receptor